MRKYFFTLTVIVCFLYGCYKSSMPTETQLNSSVNGKSINILRNYQFLLDLEVHADGGYKWDCEINDTKVIIQDSVNFRPKYAGEIKPGGATIETFYFTSGPIPGDCTINLIEHRGWEQNVPPINTIQFHVVVK